MEFLIFATVLLGNIWIWKIASFSILLALLITTSSALYYLIVSEKVGLSWLFYFLFIILVIFQWQTTSVQSLTNLTNDQQRIAQMRLREYPPVNFSLAGKTIWIPIAHWFEGRKESIATFRILKNFSEVVDPNLYFFANHPRERVGVQEFEKFPYLLLPFFIYGTFLLIEKKKGKVLAGVFIAPALLISLIGNNNPIGPHSLFPLIAGNIVVGLFKAQEKSKKLTLLKRRVIMGGFLIIYVLVLVQIISYARA